jgi:hypothetical protein
LESILTEEEVKLLLLLPPARELPASLNDLAEKAYFVENSLPIRFA